MIYGIDRAALKLGLSRRHVVRLAQELGKTPAAIGTRQKYLFTDADLLELAAWRTARIENRRPQRRKAWRKKTTVDDSRSRSVKPN
jgi:hypothetical protein